MDTRKRKFSRYSWFSDIYLIWHSLSGNLLDFRVDEEKTAETVFVRSALAITNVVVVFWFVVVCDGQPDELPGHHC